MPDYGSILKRSWKIIKKNKWLLVYGLILATLTAGGGLRLNLPPKFLENLPEKAPKGIPEKTTQVLGTLTNTFTEWLKSVSLFTWLLLIFGMLAIFILGMIIRYVTLSWAKGGLITGIQLADQEQLVSLANTSPSGIASIKNLIIFGLIVLGLTFAFLFGIPFLWFLGFSLFEKVAALKIIWIIVGIFALFSLIFLIILFSMISIYAERLIVLKKYSPWKAWKKGLSLSKKGFLPTLIMGIINSIFSASIGCSSLIILLIFLAIPVLVVIVPKIKSGDFFSIPSILTLLLILFIFINVNLLIRAILVVFKYGNWNQLFEAMLTREKGSKS